MQITSGRGAVSPLAPSPGLARKSPWHKWLWPGYGENSRVLKRICERVEGSAQARTTPVGSLPTSEALDIEGLNISSADLQTLLRVDLVDWKKEVEDANSYFDQFGDKLPAAMKHQLGELSRRLEAAGRQQIQPDQARAAVSQAA